LSKATVSGHRNVSSLREEAELLNFDVSKCAGTKSRSWTHKTVLSSAWSSGLVCNSEVTCISGRVRHQQTTSTVQRWSTANGSSENPYEQSVYRRAISLLA